MSLTIGINIRLCSGDSSQCCHRCNMDIRLKRTFRNITFSRKQFKLDCSARHILCRNLKEIHIRGSSSSVQMERTNASVSCISRATCCLTIRPPHRKIFRAIDVQIYRLRRMRRYRHRNRYITRLTNRLRRIRKVNCRCRTALISYNNPERNI